MASKPRQRLPGAILAAPSCYGTTTAYFDQWMLHAIASVARTGSRSLSAWACYLYRPLADVRSGARAVCPGPVLTRSGLRRAPSGGRRPGASGSRPAVRRGARRRPAAVREVSSGGRRRRRPASGVGRRGRAPAELSSVSARWLAVALPASHVTRHRRSVAGNIVNEVHSSTDRSETLKTIGTMCAAAHIVIYQDWPSCSTGADVAGI